MEKFPTGIRFHPSEKEKIAYLLYKVNGKPLPCNDFISISTVDLYGDEEPWEIFQDSWNRENHFFTRLKKIRQTENDGEKCCRNVGQGMWESTSPKIKIFDSRKQLIGFLKNYKYKSTKNADQDGKWLLRQYTLADKFKCCVKDEYIDFTFCSVKNNTEGYVPHQEEGSLDIESFFDQMLKENEEASSSVDAPQTSMIPENTGSAILQTNDLPDNSPSVDLELSLRR